MTRTLTSEDPPSILYKYRTWSNEFHRKLIRNQELFFSKPSSFNDPFDGNIPVRWDLLSNDDILQKNLEMSQIFHEKDSSEIQHKIAQQITIGKTIWNRDIVKKENSEDVKKWDELIGLLSLTEKKDNILMWSHYADLHKGFVVGFRTDSLLQHYDFDFLNKVIYQQNYPIISGNDEIEERFGAKFFTKSTSWEYEKEWRISKNHIKNRNVKLRLESFCEFVLGCEMPINDRKEITESIREIFGDSVNIFQAIKSEESFKLTFVLV